MVEIFSCLRPGYRCQDATVGDKLVRGRFLLRNDEGDARMVPKGGVADDCGLSRTSAAATRRARGWVLSTDALT
jgi:hypothetical protein